MKAPVEGETFPVQDEDSTAGSSSWDKIASEWSNLQNHGWKCLTAKIVNPSPTLPHRSSSLLPPQ